MLVNKDSDKFMLRFPDGMRDSMKELATKNRRSMNSEIITILDREIQQRLETEKAAEHRA